ncbi:glycoside hydrolase family 10 protein [Thalassotalea sediminis]|uniref:glycoside hydrolase family 10 protein n=1 Tax=Thalassotalea sediminis TaxID=1759089 RepID=UPI002572E04A|nr:family 10 glycosylhydrolase [Thalassotalea sediminis]
MDFVKRQIKQLTFLLVNYPTRSLIICAALILMIWVLWSKNYVSAPIEVRREFRAAWIATVANINWPSAPGLSQTQQKEEAIRLLDALQAHNFNAVILQIRPQGDALYPSELEPWSYYLTGKQGWAPNNFYDPLAFWIEQAHARGLELHAWLNPYRVHHINGGDISDQSLVKKLEEAVIKLDSGYYWLDPSDANAVNHTLNVVADIVHRYDIDGIHMDDYFYPYPSYHSDKEFPDNENYQRYLANDGQLSLGDWRRQHVNEFVHALYQQVKTIKPRVKLGISPFGIWRPGQPKWITGFDQFDKLYADARLWLQKGWVDYFSPQLYWNISKEGQSYPMLLNWWQKQNDLQRHIWPGIRTHNAKTARMVDEVQNQIMINRALLEDNTGQIFWHIGGIIDNQEMTERLNNFSFKQNALIPASRWLDEKQPDAAEIDVNVKQQVEIDIHHDSPDSIGNYVLYSQYGDKWQYQVLPRTSRKATLPLLSIVAPNNDNDNVTTSMLQKVAVSAVSKTGIESLVYITALAD